MKSLFCVAVSFMALSVPALALERASYNTDFGQMTLTAQPDGTIAGTYPTHKGKISGKVVNGDTIAAVWLQPASDRKCSKTRANTFYWGTVQWKIHVNGNLIGSWAYCDDRHGSGGRWNATVR